MNIKRKLMAASTGLGLAVLTPVVAFAVAAPTYQLGGTASDVQPGLGGSANAVQVSADYSVNGGGNVILNSISGTKLADLNTLSADYDLKIGGCGGGSPRFYTLLDTDNNGTADKIAVYYFEQNATLCAPGLHNSGNLAESIDNVQIGNIDGSETSTLTLAQVKALYPTAIITEGSIVGDANGQTIVFDNIVLNNVTYTFEPQVATNKDDCKKDNWKSLVDSNGKAFKNQGQCVSSVASAQGQENENALDKVKNFLGL
jgi:hypothetical protein